MFAQPITRFKRSHDDISVGVSARLVPENIDYLHYVDYECPENTTTDQYLLDNVALAACRRHTCRPATLRRARSLALAARYRRDLDEKWFQRKRLDNVCWRRMAKNMLRLPHMSPAIIDWDKISDSTWLYGPRVDPQLALAADMENEKASSLLLLLLDVSDTDSATLAHSMFSCDTEYELDMSSLELNYDSWGTGQSKCNPRKHALSVGSGEDYYRHTNRVKPILKQQRSYLYCGYGTSQTQPLSPTTTTTPTALATAPGSGSLRKSVTFNFVVTSRQILEGQSFDFQFMDNRCM